MMLRVWRCLGDVLSILLGLFIYFSKIDCEIMVAVIDEIIKQHPLLTHHWNIYFRSIHIVQHNPQMFSVELCDKRLEILQNMVSHLNAELMTNSIFKVYFLYFSNC